ncbi:MAG: ABC transporter ATP-binding protein [Planctomycetota bacterium]|jgi:ABC-type polysaccharide/polyol phosphate transport system ATPase subunit
MIELKQVGLKYKIQTAASTSLKRRILYALTQKNRSKTFWALRDIDLAITEGMTLGVVGINGSGKTTLCTVLAGLLDPDEGSIAHFCEDPFFLTLNTGFNMDMSGRDNILLSLTLRGLTKKQALTLEDRIIEFAELGDFIQNPVRVYSSGMRSRLAFSIATSIVPDVLIMDEVLSVGDDVFIDKSRRRMTEIIQESKALVLVSHRPDTIRQFCQEAIWLDQGRIHMHGQAEDVLVAYEAWCQQRRQKKRGPW